MAILTSELKAGDILHDVHRTKMGRTTMSEEGHWPVYVRAVADDGSWADLSWNGNQARRCHGTVPRGYKRWPKEWIAGRYCAICCERKSDGHAPNCEHPRAIAARKRAAKSCPPA